MTNSFIFCFNIITVLNCRLAEIRYSLVGISESQLQTLFELLDQEKDQIIFKRITEPRYALSDDDIVLRGNFSNSIIKNLSQILPPPLVVKIENDDINKETFEIFGSKKWVSEESTIYAGNSILPINNIYQVTGLKSEYFVDVIITSNAGSILKPYLLTKPKGLIEVKDRSILIIYPFHRMDFLLSWVKQAIYGIISFDWLSGESGELDQTLVGITGDTNIDVNDHLTKWNVHSTSGIDLNKTFVKALKIIL